MKSLKERTEEAIQAGFSVGRLAEAAGKSSSAVSQWRNGGSKEIKADSAVGLAKLTGWNVEWWISGKGPREAPTQGATSQPMAQDLSQAPSETPLIAWEELMSMQLPDVFRVQLRDDVLAPHLMAGDELIFRRSSEATAGQLVLLRDGNGNYFARKLRERLPGQFIAYAPNPAYEPLDVQALNLEIVGVLVYQSPQRGW